MKSSTIKMLAVFTAAGLLSANVALAKNGNNGGNGGNSGNRISSGLRLSLGGNSNNNNSNRTSNCHDGKGKPYDKNCGNKQGNCENYGDVQNYDQLGAGQAFEPFHSNYVVLPGDSFYVVSLKEYATSANAKYIAQFNGLPQSAALVPGQVLQLPSISVNRQLSASRAPIADAFLGTSTGNGVANFTPGTNGIGSSLTSGFGSLVNNVANTPAVEAPRPQVTVGSTLLVDGQSFGPTQGAARLRIAGAALKIEVVEWTASSVKIRLPNLDLDSSLKADIEVVRADGSLAAKTPVELGAATTVALTK